MVPHYLGHTLRLRDEVGLHRSEPAGTKTSIYAVSGGLTHVKQFSVGVSLNGNADIRHNDMYNQLRRLV